MTECQSINICNNLARWTRRKQFILNPLVNKCSEILSFYLHASLFGCLKNFGDDSSQQHCFHTEFNRLFLTFIDHSTFHFVDCLRLSKCRTHKTVFVFCNFLKFQWNITNKCERNENYDKWTKMGRETSLWIKKIWKIFSR